MNSEARGIFTQERPTRSLRPMHFGCLFWNDLYLQKQVFQFKLMFNLCNLVSNCYLWLWFCLALD